VARRQLGPFSTLLGVIGAPIEVPRDLDRPGMQHFQRLVEQQLLDLTEQADDWAERLRREGHRAAPPQVHEAGPLRKSA
jgi:hypothetical protein